MRLRFGHKFDEDGGFLTIRAVDADTRRVAAQWDLFPMSMEGFMEVGGELQMEVEHGPGPYVSEGDWDPERLAKEVDKLDRCIQSWGDVERNVNRLLDVYVLEEQKYYVPIGIEGIAHMLYVAGSIAGRHRLALIAPACTDFIYGSWVPKGMAQAWRSPIFRRPDVIVSGPVAFVRPALTP